MTPHPPATTNADYYRHRTEMVLQQSQHLRLACRQLRSEFVQIRAEARQTRQRASAQRLHSRQVREELARARQRIYAHLEAQILVCTFTRPVSSVPSPAPEKLDSLALIERCKTGERRAWNELIRRYEQMIFSFARSLCGNPTDAADITSEVFVRLFHSLHTFRRGATSFKSWLYRVVHNTYIDVCVRDSDHGHLSLDAPISPEDPADGHEVIDTAPTPEALCLHQDWVRQLADGIQTLPAYQRQVLVLYLKGRSYEAIASETGLSIGTVKSRLNRARKNLLERLEADERLPVGARLPLHRRRCLS